MFKRVKEIFEAPERLDFIADCVVRGGEAFEKFQKAHKEQHTDIQYQLDDIKRQLNELSKTQQSNMFPSGKSSLASDEPDKVPEDAEVDSITLKGKPIEYLIELLEKGYKADALINNQKRFTNRLLRLLRISAEDPGRSITEDLRKAEKWKKAMNKKLRNYREKYEQEQPDNK